MIPLFLVTKINTKKSALNSFQTNILLSEHRGLRARLHLPSQEVTPGSVMEARMRT